ncbi:MAG: BolA family transcriptional regulator [Candidatus Lindowbacteria bacterium]|nr:BolA family transcriptional regulator [Candidatus Lindowbacteria bacterium]
MKTEEIKKRIEEAWDDTSAMISDMTGTGDHFDVRVISPAFEGKSMVERHQLVYGLFPDELADQRIHAMALKTISTAELQD